MHVTCTSHATCTMLHMYVTCTSHATCTILHMHVTCTSHAACTMLHAQCYMHITPMIMKCTQYHIGNSLNTTYCKLRVCVPAPVFVPKAPPHHQSSRLQFQAVVSSYIHGPLVQVLPIPKATHTHTHNTYAHWGGGTLSP